MRRSPRWRVKRRVSSEASGSTARRSKSSGISNKSGFSRRGSLGSRGGGSRYSRPPGNRKDSGYLYGFVSVVAFASADSLFRTVSRTVSSRRLGESSAEGRGRTQSSKVGGVFARRGGARAAIRGRGDGGECASSTKGSHVSSPPRGGLPAGKTGEDWEDGGRGSARVSASAEAAGGSEPSPPAGAPPGPPRLVSSIAVLAVCPCSTPSRASVPPRQGGRYFFSHVGTCENSRLQAG